MSVRPWGPIVGVDGANIRAELDAIEARATEAIFDVFKANSVPANEWMPRLIQLHLGAAAGGVQITAKQKGIAFSREQWISFAAEVWDGTEKFLRDAEVRG